MDDNIFWFTFHCVIKEAVANEKDIDLTLFWGNSTIKYVVWRPN